MTKPYLAAEPTSIVNCPTCGGAPSTIVNGLSCWLSIQLNASCGGPVVGMVSPLAGTGRTALSAASMLGTASATPSTAATTETVSAGSGGASPKSATPRTSRSTPAVTSSETLVKLLRKPSPSTNAETTKLTARITPKVVRAKRTLFARRFLRVSRNMAGLHSCGGGGGGGVQLLSRRMWSSTA